MDVQLPGMDGLMLTRLLKADPRFADVPILALTANAMKDDEARARAAGCDGYVAKPMDVDRLLATISRLLHGSAGAANGEMGDPT
jgi:two-component system cell cycle response regulator DivK